VAKRRAYDPHAEITAHGTLTPDDVLADATAESEHLAADLKRVGEYLDRLYAKQPRESIKGARQVKIQRARAHWDEVKAFMRPLVAQGRSTEEILNKAERKFGGFTGNDRSTLLRHGLTGLRKEIKAGSRAVVSPETN
jgi:hypothetical protein